jgi:hypothetical protein
MTNKRRRPVGETIGGILVGFDQQIFRDLPPAQELVQKARPLRGLIGLGDGREVVFPADDTNGMPSGRDGGPGQRAEAVAPDE